MKWFPGIMRTVCPLAFSCLLTGCFLGSAFLTPEPVPQDEYSSSFGVSVIPEQGPVPNLELSLRTGMARNTDFGMKISGYPLRWGSFSSDVKVRLVKRPVSAAVVVGGTLLRAGWSEGIVDEGDGPVQLAGVDTYIYPYAMLIVGSERVYTGVRGLPLLVHWEDLEQTVAVFLGTSLGGQDRILPEITWIFQGRDAPAMILGLGFQWNFSRPAAP